MIKVKRGYYLRLTVSCMLIGILIGGVLYLLNHGSQYREHAIYYFTAASLLFIPGIFLAMYIQAEIYCFPQEYAAAKETSEAKRAKLLP